MERSIGEANRAAIASAVTALQLFDEVLPGVAINDPKAVIGGGQLAASASSSSSSSSSSRRATGTSQMAMSVAEVCGSDVSCRGLPWGYGVPGGIDGHAWEKLRWLRGHLQVSERKQACSDGLEA